MNHINRNMEKTEHITGTISHILMRRLIMCISSQKWLLVCWKYWDHSLRITMDKLRCCVSHHEENMLIYETNMSTMGPVCQQTTSPSKKYATELHSWVSGPSSVDETLCNIFRKLRPPYPQLCDFIYFLEEFSLTSWTC